MQRGSKGHNPRIHSSGSQTSKKLGASITAAVPSNFGKGGEGGRKMPSFKDTKPKQFCPDGKSGC